MKNVKYIIGTLVLGAILAVSCVKERGDVLSPGTFEIDTETYGAIYLDQNRQVFFIPVKTNVEESKWQFESSADWCSIGRSIGSEKGIMVSVADNTDKEESRRANVSVSAASKQYTLSVVQTGYGPAIIVSNVSIGPEGGEVYVDVVSNVAIDENAITKPQFNADDGADWIRFSGASVPTKGFLNTRYTFNVDVNELPDKREATVLLNAVDDADKKANTKCVITQNSISVTSTEIFSDDRVAPLSIRANQYSVNETAYGNGNPEKLIDGSYESYFHSPWPTEEWSGGTGTVFPVVWEFEFDGTSRLDHMSVMHRAYNGVNGSHWRGQIGNFNIYYKVNAADEYTLVSSYDWGGAGGYNTAYFPEPIENATWLKVEILDGDPNASTYGELPYIATAEVEFYDSNRSDVNTWIDKIFTDLSCSELKSGVTKKDVILMNKVSPYLATNVAMPLLNGTYSDNEKDFRIHSYEPYSDNNTNKALVIQHYTAMDNPTGVEVKAGQDILVCVDNIPAGQSVALAVYGEENEYGPNYGGAGENENYNQKTPLMAGINTVRITADGMAYVMNTVPAENRQPMSSFKSVKVHILPGCGTVQGYYDPARHSEERYQELLNKCTYKYFVVKGEKCMFLFHTNQLRTDWPKSILSGIGVWDDIVRWEHELMGLDKVEWFNNHMMAVTSSNPDVYMNAIDRRVQFGVSTIAQIGSREKMAEGTGQGTVWGPAHEMGHINQMAINWRSTTESSNNLFSNYCVMKVAGDRYYKDRWSRGKKISDLANDYAAARPWAILGDGSYQGEDPELHMRMNWQLWNYYHNCGKKPTFFPDLFAYFRDGHQLPNQAGPKYGRMEDAGLCQLEYYEACCRVAGEDLTDFFDAWGFFIPISQTYDQYGSTNYTVTTVMINAAKARVRDMNLPKAAPIQYLEDRTKYEGVTYSEMGLYTQFKDNVKITKTPVAKVSGTAVTLTGCEEAVAVEVRRGTTETGDLLYFSNLFSFTSPVNLSSNSLWAVQADGTRKKVTVQ